MYYRPAYASTNDINKDLIVRAKQFILEKITAGDNVFSEREESKIILALTDFLSTQAATYVEANEVAKRVLNNIKGYGPLEALFSMPGVTDVIVHRFDHITYEQYGKTHVWDNTFDTEEDAKLFALRHASAANVHLNYTRPFASFLTMEGYRMTVAFPPISETTTISIRRFLSVFTFDELIERGFMNEDISNLLIELVRGRRNIIVTGATSTGKTTFLASLMRYIDPTETPILIEETREMPIQNERIRRLYAREGTYEGVGKTTIADLIKLSLQMKPTRVIVSEVRDGAVFYVLQAMQIGHDGSMTTIHANSAEEAITRRIPLMLAQSPEMKNMSEKAYVEYAKGSVDVIVHLITDPYSGKRHIQEIVAVDEHGLVPIVEYKGEFVQLNAIPKHIKDKMKLFT